MLVLAYYKKWNEINIISYLFTVLFFGTWLVIKVILNEQDPYQGALFFGTLFYLLFFAMNIVHAFHMDRKFGVFEIIILSSNTFLYYAACMSIFNFFGYGDFKGIYTGLMSIFNLVFALTLYRNQNIDKILRYLLIGFGIAFLSLVAPVQFHGNYITLFWAAEFVLLYWLSDKSGLPMLKIFSFSVLFIALLSLCVDWSGYYSNNPAEVLPIILNKAFLTGAFVLTAVYSNILLMRYSNKESIFKGFSAKIYSSILSIVLAIFLSLVIYLLYFRATS